MQRRLLNQVRQAIPLVAGIHPLKGLLVIPQSQLPTR